MRQFEDLALERQVSLGAFGLELAYELLSRRRCSRSWRLEKQRLLSRAETLCVVAQYVDATEAFDRLIHAGSDLLFFVDVTGDPMGASLRVSTSAVPRQPEQMLANRVFLHI